MKERNRWILIGFCGVMVVSALVSALFRQPFESSSSFSDRNPISRFAPRQMPIAGTNPARQYSDALANAVAKVMPSVVVIRTEKVGYRKVPRDLFGFMYEIVPEQLAGEGSGVIIAEDGYVLTSWHVLEGAASRLVEVVLNDGTKLPARCIGHDQSTDLAVLKIQSTETSWPAVEFGDSDALRVGEVVIAIGSPYSFQSSVTIGNVSQKGRRIHLLPYEDFIQTDASITAGNSGGPLIDVDGRLVGINTAVLIEAKEQGADIAFSTPSNLAMVIAKSLIEKGKHEWPWVGAFFGTTGVPRETRLQVTQVWRDTPAARAGMQVGDVILEVNGRKMKDEYDILRMIYNHSVGEKLRFLIERDKKKQPEVELTLEEFPGNP
jgi:serine protease Do